MATAKELGEGIGGAVKVGGPWVLAVIAIAGVIAMAVLPSARANPFTKQDGEALERRIEAHAMMDAHTGSGRDIAAIKATQAAILRKLEEIQRLLEK